jgi:phage-related protein
MKKVLFDSKVKGIIKSFPDDVKYKIGKALFFLQRGETLQMPLSKSMPSVGKGVSELRIKGTDGIYRVFYLVKAESGILVFHAFMKKTQKTPPLEIELARTRLRELQNG